MVRILPGKKPVVWRSGKRSDCSGSYWRCRRAAETRSSTASGETINPLRSMCAATSRTKRSPAPSRIAFDIRRPTWVIPCGSSMSDCIATLHRITGQSVSLTPTLPGRPDSDAHVSLVGERTFLALLSFVQGLKPPRFSGGSSYFARRVPRLPLDQCQTWVRRDPMPFRYP